MSLFSFSAFDPALVNPFVFRLYSPNFHQPPIAERAERDGKRYDRYVASTSELRLRLKINVGFLGKPKSW